MFLNITVLVKRHLSVLRKQIPKFKDKMPEHQSRLYIIIMIIIIIIIFIYVLLLLLPNYYIVLVLSLILIIRTILSLKSTYKHILTQPWTLKKKSLNFIFPTKYVIPKSLKFSLWPSKHRESKWVRKKCLVCPLNEVIIVIPLLRGIRRKKHGMSSTP